MQTAKKNFLNLVLVVVSFLCTVFLLEIVIRLVAPETPAVVPGMDLQHFSADRVAVPDPILGYRLKKNSFVAGFHFNSEGFVGEEFSPAKPSGVYRILCLGGSTTLGAGCDADRYTYPALLMAIFAKTSWNSRARVEVINGGVFGYHSWHTLIRTEKELPAYKPDAYILMDGLNDVMAACTLMTPKELANMANSNLTVLRQMVAPPQGPAGAWISSMSSHLALPGLARRIGVWMRRPWESSQPDYFQRMAMFRFRENLETIAKESATRGIAVILVNYPWIRSDTPWVARHLGIPETHLPVYHFGRGYVASVNETLARAEHLPLVDPQELFDRATVEHDQVRRVYSDTVHFTRYGNFLLAKAIYRTLMQNPELKRITGRDAPVSEAELDSLFADILAWRPTNGGGWPNQEEHFLQTEELGRQGLQATRGDKEGWTILSPSATSGVIRMRLRQTPDAGPVFFYPRIGGGGNNSVRVETVDDNGNSKQLFLLENKTGDGLWTPISGRYDLALTKDSVRQLEVTLTGHDAQLWMGPDGWLFQGPVHEREQ